MSQHDDEFLFFPYCIETLLLVTGKCQLNSLSNYVRRSARRSLNFLNQIYCMLQHLQANDRNPIQRDPSVTQFRHG